MEQYSYNLCRYQRQRNYYPFGLEHKGCNTNKRDVKNNI